MSAAVTQWFPPTEQPENIGAYQSREQDQMIPGYQWWGGKFWGMYNLSPIDAKKEGAYKSSYQNNYWRGLAEKP